mmetsp:Transcript_2782/g.2441  ORF Transcript_2782/g.2441 Transcript_2782/m.2441 type:complete len:91 (+) Transcript_2782:32-304(+)
MSDILDKIKGIPSELKRYELLDYAESHIAIQTAVGFTVGGLASLVLFRSSGSRRFFTGLVTGAFLGYSYRSVDINLEKSIKLLTKSKENK